MVADGICIRPHRTPNFTAAISLNQKTPLRRNKTANQLSKRPLVAESGPYFQALTSSLNVRFREKQTFRSWLFQKCCETTASPPKAAIRIFEGVRELCESVLMGCDESWVLQRASAGSI